MSEKLRFIGSWPRAVGPSGRRLRPGFSIRRHNNDRQAMREEVRRSLRVMGRQTIAIPFATTFSGLILLLSSGCWRGDSLPADDPSRLTMALGSPAFSDGAMIPKAFTCDGEDRSPPLEWSGVPASARTLALISEDPDAPMGT